MTRRFKSSIFSRTGMVLLAFLTMIQAGAPYIYAAPAVPHSFVTKSKETLPTGSMSDAAYGNGRYIAVGEKGTIIQSADADHWENVKTIADINYTGVTDPSSFTFYGVAYGNGAFVTVGSDGVILSSANGEDWTQRASGTDLLLYRIEFLTFNGTGAFYALAKGRYLTSTDGTNWTTVIPTGIGADKQLTQVTVGNNGTRLAFSSEEGKIYSTTTGTDWTSIQPYTPDSIPANGANFLKWMNDRYFMADISGFIWTSTDLVTFTLMGPPFKQTFSTGTNQMRKGFYDGTTYYLFGSEGSKYGAVYTSTDAINWTLQPYEREFVDQQAEYINGKYFLLGNEGLSVSDTGSDWKYKWGGNFNEIIFDGSKYIAAGQLGKEGTIWISTDLSSWTKVEMSGQADAFTSVAQGNGKYVAVAGPYHGETSLATSSDGTNWGLQSSLMGTEYLTDIAYGAGLFVTVGAVSNQAVIETSMDGVTWTSQTVPSSLLNYLSSVTYINNEFVALGNSYNSNGNISEVAILTSPDGIHWTDRSGDYPNTTDFMGNIIYDGSQYILLGYDSSTYEVITCTSPDLVTWSSARFTGGYLLYGGSTFIGKKDNTLYALLTNSTYEVNDIYYSNDDGVTWYTSSSLDNTLGASALMSVNDEIIVSGPNKLVLATSVTSSSAISPGTANFDKETSAQADVSVTLTLNGNTLSSITNGATTLTAGTDYTLSGNVVTISQAYLAQQTEGTTSLTFNFSAGASQVLTVTVSDSTPPEPEDSSLSQTTASFDKETSAQADVSVTLTLNGNTLSSITNGATTLTAGTDYTLSGNVVTISKAYLAQQTEGTTSLTFNFSAGAAQVLTVTVSDSTPAAPEDSSLSETTASFDKETSAQADVSVTLTLNGNTLSSITNGATTLTAGTDYTLSGNVVTISKAYLAQQTVGTTSLTFNFSAGAAQVLTVTVSDSTPPEPEDSSLSETTANFDKETSAQADVSVTLTLNGNTLSSITNGATTLTAGTDYTLSGNVVTISQAYLAQQTEGTTSLTFNFSAGASQVLTVTVSDSTPPEPEDSSLSQTTASFDKETSAQADVSVTLTLNGNTLSSITNGATTLTAGTDYTLSGNVVTISKAYLAQQTEGTTSLTFNFSAGAAQVLTVTVSDSTPTIGEAPLLTEAVVQNARVSLQWSPSNGATGYKIYQALQSGAYGTEIASVSNSVFEYDVTGLTNGTTYYFVIKAVYAGGNSALSNEKQATPQTLPGIPTDISAIAGDGRATITFTAPANNGGSMITGYQILDQSGQIVATGISSPITVTGLTNGTGYRFTVKALNAVGASEASVNSNTVIPVVASSGGGGSTVPSNSTTQQPTSTTPPTEVGKGVDIWINGRLEKIGVATDTTVNNRQVTTIRVDQSVFESKLASEGQGAVITIPFSSNKSDIIIGELTGQMIKSMEEKQAILEIRTELATYTIPALRINVGEIAKQLGQTIDLKDVTIQVEVGALNDDMLNVVQSSANKGNFKLVAPSLDFSIRGIYGDKVIPVTHFNAYVERTIAIPDGVNPNQITTGIVVEPDGAVRHVPTKVIRNDGKYYATINSLTNSAYSIIWNPLEFEDVAKHWAKDSVNNMGSRLVINGVGNGLFNPDDDITRAEFAAVMVRGLGLKLKDSGTVFSDVSAAAWYNSAIQTAYNYGLINGFKDGTFHPTDKITREQAMVIIAKAMTITGVDEKLAMNSSKRGIFAFEDAVKASSWATDDIENVLNAGIVTGRSEAMLAPKANMTRAEVAAIVERLLKISGLI
ncbi:X2-like carbohydrate binding domain-containing protein [Paenibacillus sp. FSL R7-0198]|uniref:X2-like carbohydrate binding domain-containing protein n=1 Tax=Paenibacillus sp. FSL R7-0198 TaxID=2921674 RepID=UPI0030F964F2